MTEPNPEAQDLPLPDHVLTGDDADDARARYGGSGPDPVKATAPRHRADDVEEEGRLDDDEKDESADDIVPPVAFPAGGPMQGTAVPPGYVNPQ